MGASVAPLPTRWLAVGGRVVIVTGTAGGIGPAIAAEFESLGDTVVGLDLVDGFDVRDPDQCRAIAEHVEQDHGRVDVLCNNAGVGAVGDVTQATVEDWHRVSAVDVFGIGQRWPAASPPASTCSTR